MSDRAEASGGFSLVSQNQTILAESVTPGNNSAAKSGRYSRSARLALGGLLVGGLVTGCAQTPLPTPAAAAEGDSPALTEEQNLLILAEIDQVLSEAGAARNPELLPERLTGPALYVRSSQLRVADIINDDSLVTVLPASFQQLIIPTTTTWPRTAFAITNVTEELQPPRLLALVQASPRDQYKLWGWVQLLPGVQMPAFDDPRVGSAELPPDDDSLKLTPTEAVRQYADLLSNRDASAYLANFEPVESDHFRDFITRLVAAQEAALAEDRVEGTYSLVAQPAGSTILAVRTDDGGALVMAELITDERLQAVEGAVLTPQTQTALALLTGSEFTNILTAQYRDIIALHVPAAGSADTVRLLGYSHIQTGASVGDYDEYADEAGDEAGENGENGED